MTVLRIAKKLQQEYERHYGRRFMCYAPLPWHKIDQASKQEHIDIVRAVLAGESKFNGKRIPPWVQDLVREEAGKR